MKEKKIPKCLKEFYKQFEDVEEFIDNNIINVYPYNNQSKFPIMFNREKGRFGIPKELRKEDGSFDETKLSKSEIKKLESNYGGTNTKEKPMKIVPSYYKSHQLGFEYFRPNNNISFTIGFQGENTNLHLCVLDIDGIKVFPKDEEGNTLKSMKYKGKNETFQYDERIHKRSCEEIYKVLSDWKEETIDETTWSGGKHLYFFSSENLQTKEFGDDYFLILRYIHFPRNFPIKELQGKPINDDEGERLEVFSKLGSQRCLCSPSYVQEKKLVKDVDGTITLEKFDGKYSLITKNPSFKKLYENPITNLEESLKNQFIKHGFEFDEEGFKKAKHNMKSSKAIAKETIEEVMDENGEIHIPSLNHKGKELIIQECVNIIEKTKGKHYEVLIGLEGGLEYLGLNQEERKDILEQSLKITHPNEKDFKEHWNQIKSSFNSSKNKKGFGKHGLGRLPKIKPNIELIKLYKRMYWKNVDDSNFNIFKCAYDDFLKTLNKYIKKMDYVPIQRRIEEYKTTQKMVKYVLEYLDEVFESMGLEKSERFELMEIGSELFYNNKKVCLEEFMEKERNMNESYLHGLDMKTFQSIIKTFYKITTPMDERIPIDWDEIKNKWYTLESLFTILEITNSQPIKNLYIQPPNIKDHVRRKQASSYLRKKCGLRKTQTNTYLWNEFENCFKQITLGGLGDYISRKFGISGIEKDELQKVYDSSDKIMKEDDSICRMEDGFLHVENGWEFEETKELQKYFTLRTYPFNYNESLILKDLKEPTLHEKVLKEIFVPKYNQEDESLYVDFLERIGSCLNQRNMYRKLTIYYGLGSNGKEIIISVLKNIFGTRCVELNIEQVMKDDFRNLNESDVWIFDELEDDDFEGLIAKLKNLTGGKDKGSTKRKMRTQEYFEEKYPSMVYCFTNTIPNIPLNETAFFNRCDILTLPNTFVSQLQWNRTNNHHNLYIKDSTLKEKLRKDEIGKQWLFSKMCSIYKKGLDEQGESFEFHCSQSEEETKQFITQNDPLKTFLVSNYELDSTKTSRIFNDEICEEFKDWCEERKVVYNERNLKQKMGTTIKILFGSIKEKSNGVWYPLKPIEDVEWNEETPQEFQLKKPKKKTLYVINESKDWIMEKSHHLKDHKRKVYNFIKDYETKNGVGVSYERLSKEFTNICDVKKTLDDLLIEDLLEVVVGM